MRIRAVLCDFDHTLVDSPLDFAWMRQGVRELIAAAGVTVATEGLLTLEVLAAAVAQLPAAPGAALRAAAEAHVLAVELAAAEHACEIPGAAAALAQLRADGRRVGILTRNARPVVEQVLRQIELPHDVLVCRDDLPRPHLKPAPEHAWAVLAALDCPTSTAVLVGDFSADLECARRAGLPGIGVLTGDRDAATLRAAGACAVLPSIAALPAWLRDAGW
ncbi:MAG: HAD family hydrolase [Fimbriimonadaceae bacterium]|nr:HAD family hydrolase [Fimbriimonadaceae bacterium]